MNIKKVFFGLLIILGFFILAVFLYESPQSYFYKHSSTLRDELPRFCKLMEAQIPKLESPDENIYRDAVVETSEIVHKEFSENFGLAFMAINNAEIKTQFELYVSLAKEAHLEQFDCPAFKAYLDRKSQLSK